MSEERACVATVVIYRKPRGFMGERSRYKVYFQWYRIHHGRRIYRRVACHDQPYHGFEYAGDAEAFRDTRTIEHLDAQDRDAIKHGRPWGTPIPAGESPVGNYRILEE